MDHWKEHHEIKHQIRLEGKVVAPETTDPVLLEDKLVRTWSANSTGRDHDEQVSLGSVVRVIDVAIIPTGELLSVAVVDRNRRILHLMLTVMTDARANAARVTLERSPLEGEPPLADRGLAGTILHWPGKVVAHETERSRTPALAALTATS